MRATWAAAARLSSGGVGDGPVDDVVGEELAEVGRRGVLKVWANYADNSVRG